MSTTGAGAEAEVDDAYHLVFNSKDFSDRELRVEVVGRDNDAPGAGGSLPRRKRRREEDEGVTAPAPIAAAEPNTGSIKCQEPHRE
ncbi:hypothetical protein TRIUR3_05006 [Triticum urartu]|uniref:Uncharacterized protein n=1 Tax=Triticum urartu TaxID=4572 RepID=M8A2E0_TRIUA|nr:hypothetical protein TRIUR3_05006 [Triticum urartu]